MNRECVVSHEKPLGDGRFRFFVKGAVYNPYDFAFELGDLFFVDEVPREVVELGGVDTEGVSTDGDY